MGKEVLWEIFKEEVVEIGFFKNKKVSAEDNLAEFLEKNPNIEIISISQGGSNLVNWYTVFYYEL